MPIKKYIKVKMRSAEINRLNVAYAKTLRMLDLVDRFDPVTEIVAKKVINVGTSDPQGIADAVVRHFRKVHDPRSAQLKCPV